MAVPQTGSFSTLSPLSQQQCALPCYKALSRKGSTEVLFCPGPPSVFSRLLPGPQKQDLGLFLFACLRIPSPLLSGSKTCLVSLLGLAWKVLAFLQQLQRSKRWDPALGQDWTGWPLRSLQRHWISAVSSGRTVPSPPWGQRQFVSIHRPPGRMNFCRWPEGERAYCPFS